MSQSRPFVRRFSLRAQLIAAFLFVGLVGIGLFALLYNRETRQALIGEANQTLYAAASRTAASLDIFIQTNLENIRVEASLPLIETYMALSPEEREESVVEQEALGALENFRNKDLFHIVSYALLDMNGVNVLDTQLSSIGSDESQKEYFLKPLQSGRPFMSGVEFAPRVGGVYFYFSSPVRNELGQITGVLRARYSIAILQQMVSESRGLAGPGSFAVLFNDYGLRLAHDREPQLIFKTIVPLEETVLQELQKGNRLPNLDADEMATNWPEFAKGLANAEQNPFFAANEHAEDHIDYFAVVELETQPWQVVYAMPQEAFLSPINTAIQMTILWSILFSLFLIVVAVWLARWLTKPVVELTAVTEQIAEGDLMARAKVDSNDEIGQLAIAFNNMTDQLKQTLEGLENREKDLQESNKQLEAALIELQETQTQMVQQERIAAVGQLAAGIAHDFNNIMATIILYSDLMLKTGDLAEKDEKRLNLIRDQGQRAADLTQQILDFSRKSIMQRQDLDLWNFLSDMRNLLVRTLPENISFGLISNGDQFIVNIDPTRMQQVILNLVINARNAMSDGGDIRIRLSDVCPDEDSKLSELENGPWVCLAVSDTGDGIEDEVLAHIFEPFFTTRAPLGSGLGLSQVEGIVKQHGGKIVVETEVGAGTEFKIYLPGVSAVGSESNLSTEKKLVPGHGEIILLVEDDSLIRDALTHSLQSLNYVVLCAPNGHEALSIYQNHEGQIDLVLSDLVMPEMGGKEMLQILKRKDPSLKMVVITGYPVADEETALSELGIMGWCQKPVNLEELSQIVSNAIHSDNSGFDSAENL